MAEDSLQPPPTGMPAPAASTSERHATWLELFFDLVFVAAITRSSSQLSLQDTLPGLVLYLALLVPIWWAWLGHTVYANRFSRDDAFHRVITCIIMLAAAGMAVQIPRFPSTGGIGFALAYCLARACLLASYARVRHEPGAGFLSRLYIRGFGLGALIWLGSLLVAPPLRYGLWLAGMAIDLMTPWLGRAGLQRMPLHMVHLTERVGLFTLIVLGESIATVVESMGHVTWAMAPFLVAMLAFVIALCIWWSYFSFVESASYACTLGSGQPYLYSHLPLTLGLTGLAAGIKRAVYEASAGNLTEPTLVLLGLGTVAWLLSFLLIKEVSYTRPVSADGARTAVGVIVVLILLAFGRELPPVVLFTGLSAVFIAVALVSPPQPPPGSAG